MSPGSLFSTPTPPLPGIMGFHRPVQFFQQCKLRPVFLHFSPLSHLHVDPGPTLISSGDVLFLTGDVLQVGQSTHGPKQMCVSRPARCWVCFRKSLSSCSSQNSRHRVLAPSWGRHSSTSIPTLATEVFCTLLTLTYISQHSVFTVCLNFGGFVHLGSISLLGYLLSCRFFRAFHTLHHIVYAICLANSVLATL